MITTIKVFTCSYIKKVSIYAFLIKLLATTKQLIRRNSILLFKKPGIFFHRVSMEIDLTLPHPKLGFIRSLRAPSPLHNKPFIKKDSLEEMEGVNDNANTFMHPNIKRDK